MSAIVSSLETGTEERARGLRRFAIPALTTALIAAACGVILAHPRPAVWDQQALLAASFRAPELPSPARGFTSQLIVASYRAVTAGEGASLNSGVRVVAAALYLAAAAWLGASLLRRRALVALLLAFVASSRYPLLWLSSELFAGAFLMAAVAAWSRGASPWILGALLALLGLCKPDVIVVSIALLGYWVHRSDSSSEAWALVAGFGVALGVLLLPGTVSDGVAYFRTYGGSGGRGFASFAQHYAALVAPLQVAGPPPNPWTETGIYMARQFPDAHDMGDVVFGHFPRYASFVALATVRGLFRAGYLFHSLVLAIPCLVWGWRRGGFTASEREKALLVCFVGLLPFVLFAYPHIRYLARYYPLVVLLMLASLERVLAIEEPAARRPILLSAGLCISVALAENLRRLAVDLAHVSQLDVYWFPD